MKYVAGRLSINLPNTVETADLISYGIFGLIDAIEKYEPDRGIKFETYAIARIKGAILDELRAMDWVPRSVRARAREIERAYIKLENELRRVPSDAEVADEIGVSEKDLADIFTKLSLHLGHQLRRAVDARAARRTTRKTSVLASIKDENAEDPVASFEAEEVKEILADAIEKLPERERLVIAPLLLRGPDAQGDRPGPLRDREPRLAAAHQGGAAPAGAAALRAGVRARRKPGRRPGRACFTAATFGSASRARRAEGRLRQAPIALATQDGPRPRRLDPGMDTSRQTTQGRLAVARGGCRASRS